VLLRLAYLGVTNTFAMLRLLSKGDREKELEILVLRHQIGVLQRPLGGMKVQFAPADRVFLAALLCRLPGTGCAGCGYWCAPTRSCAGTATCWPDATPPRPGRNAQAAREPYAPSEPVSYVWRRTTLAGDTAGSTGNCLFSG
jgi:hypothetical protein